MIYQLNGKVVKKKPTGKFKKIVTIPGKLMNFITKESGDWTANFWISPKFLINLSIALLKSIKGWTHIAIVQKRIITKIYVNGQVIKG